MGALKHLGLQFTGTHHRGIDDAVNIAEILKRTFSPDYQFKLLS